ncbi:MAG: hypothetical protein H7840_17945, partial [Alphaproteobacteria bacterium]
MTTLTDLTMSQFATAYGALTGIASTAKSCNGKAKWISRLEALMSEKGFTLADVLAAAGIEPKAEEPIPDTIEAGAPPAVATRPAADDLEQDVTAAEADFTGMPPAEEPVVDATAANQAPPDPIAILTSSRVFIDVFGLVGQYLIKTHGLDEMTAANAAQRAVFALAPPAPPAPRTPPAPPAPRAAPRSRADTK